MSSTSPDFRVGACTSCSRVMGSDLDDTCDPMVVLRLLVLMLPPLALLLPTLVEPGPAPPALPVRPTGGNLWPARDSLWPATGDFGAFGGLVGAFCVGAICMGDLDDDGSSSSSSSLILLLTSFESELDTDEVDADDRPNCCLSAQPGPFIVCFFAASSRPSDISNFNFSGLAVSL